MSRETISVVILAKNEEKIIANCLESVKWADEVIIVDGISTDRTVEIAESYGAKVVPHKFEGDFGQERNIGIDNSNSDWFCSWIVMKSSRKDSGKSLQKYWNLRMIGMSRINFSEKIFF